MRGEPTTKPREPAFTRETPGPVVHRDVSPPNARRGRTREDWLSIPAHMGGKCFCGAQCANPTDPTLVTTEAP